MESHYIRRICSAAVLLPAVSLCMVIFATSATGMAYANEPAASLSLSASVDGVSLSKPGPQVAAGSSAQMAVRIRNTGDTALQDISINGRQKLPSLMPWRTLCTVLRLEAGDDAICTVNQLVPAGIFKALIVASTSANGQNVQVLDNIFLRGAANGSTNPDPAPPASPPAAPPTAANPAELVTQATVNNESGSRPGPLVTSNTANWIYTVSNQGGVAVNDVVVRMRQKLPTLQPWRTICMLNTLAPGASNQCAINEPVVEGIYKALVVSQGVSSHGAVVESLTDAFYRSSGEQESNPGNNQGNNQGNPTVPQNPTTEGEPASGMKGYKSLFAGHSFFKPITHDFTWLAAHAGFTEHQQTVIYSSGATGAPEALWNDDDNRRAIQNVLDQGDVGLFGMTYHDDYPGEQAYIQWADYAFDKNPDTAFFIAMPWGRWPGRYNVNEMEQFWSHHHENIIHRIVDTLRTRHPGKKIFCVPYGMASTKLKTLQQSGNLPDVQQLIGDHLTSVYNDELGHTGVLMKRLGALVWLQAIYGVDMQRFDYHDPYTTDLKALAADIMAVHDGNYDDPQD